MKHRLHYFSLAVLLLCPLARGRSSNPGTDINEIDPKKVDFQLLINLQELGEYADQIPAARLAIEHAEEDAARAYRRLQTDEALKKKSVISDYELIESETNAKVKTVEVEIASVNSADTKFRFEIKKQSVEEQLGNKANLKDTAQLLANQRKARLDANQLLQKKAQLELDFLEYRYQSKKELFEKSAAGINELLDILRDRNKAVQTVASLAKHREELQKLYAQAQELANKLSR